MGLFLFCSAFVYAQEVMVLDDAIKDSVDFFSSRLQSGSTVAVTNFEAEKKDLSDFIIQELLVAFANTGKVRVVERSRLEMLQSELNFNMSGSVSDETAQGIGHMIGAQILFSGSISQYRDMYRMRIQAIAVETAEVIGTRTLNVKYDPTLTGLLGRIDPADKWKYQWFYAGVSVGYGLWANDDLENETWDLPRGGLGFSIYTMVQLFNLFGIALDFSGVANGGVYFSILPTLTIRPSSFEFDLFLGVGYDVIYANTLILGGVRGGYKIGPGILFAEVRPKGYVWSGIDSLHEFGLHYHFTLGYQIGFIPRKK